MKGRMEKLKIVVFLAKHMSLHISVNSDVTDTFTHKFLFEKLCLLSFHSPKINKGGRNKSRGLLWKCGQLDLLMLSLPL